MGLAKFLGARLDDDEAAANSVTFRSRFFAVGNSVQSPGGIGHPPMPIADVIDPETAEHIARHDPARVLREVDAKRKIVAMHEQAIAHKNGPLLDYCQCQAEDGVVYGHWPCETLAAVAAIYSDHPDYQHEWEGASDG